MECLKSFVIRSTGNETVNSGTSLDTWGASPQISFSYQSFTKTSTFNTQGFKNINIHAVEVVGDLGSRSFNSGNQIVVNDWAFRLLLNGTMQTVSGNIQSSPNDFNMILPIANPIIDLSKYNSRINFADPITSVTSISILDLRASGISAENLLTINIAWLMNFVFYYTYEGEN